MTTHDQRAATDPTRAVEPEFSSAGTEAPREPDERAADPIRLSTTHRRYVPNSRKLGRCRRRRAEPAQTTRGRSAEEAEPAQASDVQPSVGGTTPSRRAMNCCSPQTPPGCGRGGTTSRRRLSTTPQSACRRPTRLWRRSWKSSRRDSEARSRLEAQWARGENASTEDLRVALQRHREFFQRLLAV